MSEYSSSNLYNEILPPVILTESKSKGGIILMPNVKRNNFGKIYQSAFIIPETILALGPLFIVNMAYNEND